MIYLPFNLIALIMPWMRHKAYFPCRSTISDLPNLKIRSEDQPPRQKGGEVHTMAWSLRLVKRYALKHFWISDVLRGYRKRTHCTKNEVFH